MTNPEDATARNACIGTWHLYEMDLWDAHYPSMEVQAVIRVRPDYLGRFSLG